MLFRFQAALVKYGVKKVDIFQTNDLSEKKDIANVTNTIYALGRAVILIQSNPDLRNLNLRDLDFRDKTLLT